MKLQMLTKGQPTSSRGRVSPYYVSACTDNSMTAKTQSSVCARSNDILDSANLKCDFSSPVQQYYHLSSIHSCEQTSVENSTNVSPDDLLLVEEHIRPLIKEELRYTIQSKRRARGLPSTIHIEYKAPQPDDVSPETLVKRERRRERNKVAAAKCRFKKKIVSEKLQEESDHLENINLKLKREIQRLQEERQKLKYILNLHKPTCSVHRDDENFFPATDDHCDIKQTNDINDAEQRQAIAQSFNIAGDISDQSYSLISERNTWESTLLQSVNEYVDSLMSASMSENSSTQQIPTLS